MNGMHMLKIKAFEQLKKTMVCISSRFEITRCLYSDKYAVCIDDDKSTFLFIIGRHRPRRIFNRTGSSVSGMARLIDRAGRTSVYTSE